MNSYHVIVDGQDGFTYEFDGEPQINLTFERDGKVYKVITRAHDEDGPTSALHAEIV